MKMTVMYVSHNTQGTKTLTGFPLIHRGTRKLRNSCKTILFQKIYIKKWTAHWIETIFTVVSSLMYKFPSKNNNAFKEYKLQLRHFSDEQAVSDCSFNYLISLRIKQTNSSQWNKSIKIPSVWSKNESQTFCFGSQTMRNQFNRF